MKRLGKSQMAGEPSVLNLIKIGVLLSVFGNDFIIKMQQVACIHADWLTNGRAK